MSAPHSADENRSLVFLCTLTNTAVMVMKSMTMRNMVMKNMTMKSMAETTTTTNMATGNMEKTSAFLLRLSPIFGKSKAASMR